MLLLGSTALQLHREKAPGYNRAHFFKQNFFSSLKKKKNFLTE